MRDRILVALRPFVVALCALLLGVSVTALAGENPLHVLAIMAQGAFGTPYDIGMTILYSTPLIFTGLAVALPFHAGLFNIGAEGQLTMGALAAMVAGVMMPPSVGGTLGVMGVTLAAFTGGAAWGFIPGWLKAQRGSHEVISTIMLNFIAAGLASWVVLNGLRSIDTQNPESLRVAAVFMLEHFGRFDGAPVTIAAIFALVMVALAALFLRFTVRGFEWKATGANAVAAQTAGIDTRRAQMGAMAVAGGMAGLVGMAEILGNSGRFRIGFSPDYGFIGIPVALLARSNPVGVIFSALLFGALQKGTAGLDLETDHVTRDLASIIQAVVVLTVSLEGVLSRWPWRRKKDKPA